MAAALVLVVAVEWFYCGAGVLIADSGWFKVAMSIALPIACLVGIRYGKRSARA